MPRRPRRPHGLEEPSTLTRQLPPLTALRAFEATARLGHAGRAADELEVTPSAVSHQLRVLEENLGVRLFDRVRQRLKLTPAGEVLLETVRRAFDEIARTAGELDRPPPRGRLVVRAPDLFTRLVLLRRLGGFAQAFPAIELTVQPEPTAPDVVIERGWNDRPERWSRQFGRAEQVPVCAPALLNRLGDRLRLPGDLRRLQLIHEDDGSAWARFLLLAGLEPQDPARGLFLGGPGEAAEAARQGLGVALGCTVLLAEELSAGRLVRPLDAALPSERQWFVSVERARLGDGVVRALLGWLWRQPGQALESEG
jgi:LysR family glycine cleavage system transcriptional activator